MVPTLVQFAMLALRVQQAHFELGPEAEGQIQGGLMALMTGRYGQMQRSYDMHCRQVCHLRQEHLLLMMPRREKEDPGHL